MLRGRLYGILMLVMALWIAALSFAISKIDTATVENGPVVALTMIGVFVVGMIVSLFAVAKLMLGNWDKKYAVSAERQRYMAFGIVLLKINGESCRMFKLRNISKGKAKGMLQDWWGIKDRNEAIHISRYLSVAEGHTPFADDVYNNLIKKGQLGSPTQTDLHSLKDENAHQVDRINAAIRAYIPAKKMLIKLGYTEAELSKIDSLAAWDYGRTAYIARYSANVGYMQEEEAWQYIQAAAENAAKVYSSWREYLAAYILGRAIGYGDNSTDLYWHLNGLLSKPQSSFQELSFK